MHGEAPDAGPRRVAVTGDGQLEAHVPAGHGVAARACEGRSADVTAAGSASVLIPADVTFNLAGHLGKSFTSRKLPTPLLGSKQHLSPKVQSTSTVLSQT